MPRFSLQRLIRLVLYAACTTMAIHAVYMLRSGGRSGSYAGGFDGQIRLKAGDAEAHIGGGGSSGGSPNGEASPDEETSLAGRRRMASIKAIAPELLLRIGRPVALPYPSYASSFAATSDAADVDPSKLVRPLLLTRSPQQQLLMQQQLANFSLMLGEAGLPPLYSLDEMDPAAVQEGILLINSAQEVLNDQLYRSPISEVIVVQVHDRIEYLYLLIDSLRRAKDIEDCLIVFSHDVYSSAINSLVRSIRFARVLQVFFPYSKQIYYNRFPGTDPRDCPRDAGGVLARSTGCVNAEWPDSYGHYREAKYTQTKHHWLYKMHFLFERARVLANYTGQVVFLEEDHYVVEDFLHVLRLMDASKRSLYRDVEILTLATYEKKPDFTRDTGQTVVDKWVSSFHNMGMAFGRDIWDKIRPCLKSFCQFDDYNWDWSLNFILNSCAKRPFQTMVIRVSPRVFHIGECGVHHKKKVCNPVLLTTKLDAMLADNIAHLYPERLTFNAKLKIRARSLKPNGGWGDRRDVELCLSFFNSSQQPPAGLPPGL